MWSIFGECGNVAILGAARLADDGTPAGNVGYTKALDSLISLCLNLATLLVILPNPVTGRILSLAGDDVLPRFGDNIVLRPSSDL